MDDGASKSYLSFFIMMWLIREFTFDVDVSQLPCGLNGALYFVEMDEDGGKGRFPTNKVGLMYLCLCVVVRFCVYVFSVLVCVCFFRDRG